MKLAHPVGTPGKAELTDYLTLLFSPLDPVQVPPALDY